jgi:hypothetical protein
MEGQRSPISARAVLPPHSYSPAFSALYPGHVGSMVACPYPPPPHARASGVIFWREGFRAIPGTHPLSACPPDGRNRQEVGRGCRGHVRHRSVVYGHFVKSSVHGFKRRQIQGSPPPHRVAPMAVCSSPQCCRRRAPSLMHGRHMFNCSCGTHAASVPPCRCFPVVTANSSGPIPSRICPYHPRR